MARQLAEIEAQEERERAVEVARIAEEARKQEEEQRRRAEETVVQQGAVAGLGARPMVVDEPTEEEQKKKKKKNKGKEKQTVGNEEEEEEMELVGGAAHCCACVRDGAQCQVNTWASVKAGRVTARAPTGTLCDLLGTMDLQEKVNEKKAELAAEEAKADAKKKLAEVEEKVASGSK